MQNYQISLNEAYNSIKNYVIQQGYIDEIKWQEDIRFENINETDFLREAAWVILSAGMKEQIIRKVFADISFSFLEWESAGKIIEMKSFCFEEAKSHFNNPRKIQAIISAAEIITKTGFQEIRNQLLTSPIETLKTFPFIGPITSYHLAKNLGLPVAKPDRHLVRLSNSQGYNDVQTFCLGISKTSGDTVAVVDIVLWRFANIKKDYINEFLNLLDDKTYKLPDDSLVCLPV